ncbi:ABC transporter substrate-binding protein [Phormidesmis sp. 146-12]
MTFRGLVPTPNLETVKKNLQYIAQIVGQEEKAKEVLVQYQKRIKELQEHLGDQLQQTEVSVIIYGDSFIGGLLDKRGIGVATQVLTDIGLRQNLTMHDSFNLSIETIDEFDADVLFIADAHVDKKTPDFYFQNSLINSLEAVKNGRVYIVDQEAWRVQGMSGANKILDDLEKYLVNTP